MKLSDLKAMVADIEKNVTESNTNPDVRFWLPRTSDMPRAGDKESDSFVELDIDTTHEVRDHRISAICRGTVQQCGDYTIPVIVTPFYK